MVKSLKIILLGSLPKGDEVRKTWIDWKKEYIEKIGKAIPEAKFMHGDYISDKEGARAVVGHDLYLVKHSGICVVNASTKVGVGTAQEILIAKKFKIPVIAVIPKNSHHRKSQIVFYGEMLEDFINPFLVISTDKVVENIEEAIVWLKKFQKNKSIFKTKDLSVMEECIKYFEGEHSDLAKKYKKEGW